MRIEFPGPGDEALVEVGLLSFEEGVVGGGVEEVLGAGGFLIFLEVGGESFGVAELFGSERDYLGGREIADGEEGLVVGEEVAFVPLDFDPGGISGDEVEAAPAGKDICKLEFPVEEAAAAGEVLDEGEAGELAAEFVHIHDAGGIVEVHGGLDTGGGAAEVGIEDEGALGKF